MIRIKIASYALNDFLWACYCSNIKDITVTKEDNDLIIYLKLEVPKEELFDELESEEAGERLNPIKKALEAKNECRN